MKLSYPVNPMRVDAKLIVLPYKGNGGQFLLDRLIQELESGHWTEFRAAVAFARWTGNYPDLLDALYNFAQAGNRVSLTFSAEEFGKGGYATDFQAVEELTQKLETAPRASVHLYREPGRTFHPKIYLFSNEERALLILGSSNWGYGGLVNNIEANVALSLDLEDDETHREYSKLLDYFEGYWIPRESDG